MLRRVRLLSQRHERACPSSRPRDMAGPISVWVGLRELGISSVLDPITYFIVALLAKALPGLGFCLLRTEKAVDILEFF